LTNADKRSNVVTSWMCNDVHALIRDSDYSNNLYTEIIDIQVAKGMGTAKYFQNSLAELIGIWHRVRKKCLNSIF
jgi:hypothetical protein